MKTRWFERIQKDAQQISPHLRFVRIRNGFWRIYWGPHYIAECFENMPENGYDLTDVDHRLEEKDFYEEYMLDGDKQKLIKNFVEGYWETLDKLQTRAYMFKNNHEFNKTSTESYKTLRIH